MLLLDISYGVILWIYLIGQVTIMRSNDAIMMCCAVLRSYDAILWIYLIGQFLFCIVLDDQTCTHCLSCI